MKDLSKISKNPMMLCNMIYQKGNALSDWEDYLNIIYKDLKTGEKKLHIIKQPEIEYYVVPEENRNQFKSARHFLPVNELEKRECKYKNILLEIAKEMGEEGIRYYKQNKSNYDRKQLYKYPYVLGGDIDIETIYRHKWKNECKNDYKKVPSKLFLDIEVDQIDHVGPIATEGECPINAITMVDVESMTSYGFFLDDPNNPQIEEFKNNIDKFIEDLHDDFDEVYGKMDYKIFMIKDELDLITQTFNLIHHLKRDFCLIWNMRFDANYIICRLRELGVNPADIMCHPDFKLNTLFYYTDKNPKNFDYDKRGDYFDISSYTAFVDQLKVYVSLRKSQGASKSNNLGAVAQTEIGEDKLDYGEVANIRTFAWDNFYMFAKYSLKDTLLQYGIDRKVNDVDNIYLSSYNNCCSYKGVMKQTVCLRSFMYDDFISQGIILGHNVNFDNDNSLSIDFFDDDYEDDEFGYIELSEDDKKKKKFKGE